MKITVIATGFDRSGAQRMPAASATQTPIDLTHYAKPQPPMPVPVVPRPAVARRPAIEMAQMPMAVGAEGQMVEGLDESSPLDVPAFMRRHDS